MRLGELTVKIALLAKYEDDIFAVVKRKNTSIIFEQLKKYHRRLQSTVEVERDGCIPFLDIKQKAERIYHQPTSFG